MAEFTATVPLISVVVPTFNRRRALADCLGSLAGQNLRATEFEVVVVIDGSTDGTAEMLRASSLPIRPVVIRGHVNQGAGHARNLGVAAARAETVLFLDDDMLCDSRLLSAHIEAHRAAGGEAVIVVGRTDPFPHERFRYGFQDKADPRGRTDEAILPDGWPKWPRDAWVGPNCSLPRAIFLESGGYDEQLPRMEDTELGYKLWKRGLPFLFCANARAWVGWEKTPGTVWRDDVMDGRASVKICRRYPDAIAHSQFAAIARFPPGKRLAARILSRTPWLIGFPLQVLISVLERLPQTSGIHRLGTSMERLRCIAASMHGVRLEAGTWRQVLSLFGPPLPVLTYHHIGEMPDNPKLRSISVTPSRFENQIKWLRRLGFETISPQQWVSRIEGAESLPRKPIIIAIDDGYQDTIGHVVPILARFGMHTTVFTVGTQCRLMHGALLADAATWASSSGQIDIGTHSANHRVLTMLNDTELETELMLPAQELRDLGLPATAIAYPFGKHDTRVRQAAGRIYRLGFTCEEGLNSPSSDLLALRRSEVQPGDTAFDVVLKAHWGFNPFRRTLSLLVKLFKRKGGRQIGPTAFSETERASATSPGGSDG